MQGTQHTQEVANDIAGICHVIWLASNQRCILNHALLPLYTLHMALLKSFFLEIDYCLLKIDFFLITISSHHSICQMRGIWCCGVKVSASELLELASSAPLSHGRMMFWYGFSVRL